MASTTPFTGLFGSIFDLESLSNFTFTDQAPSHLLYFATTIILLCISLTTAVMAALDKNHKLRFVWAIGCIVGFGKGVVVWKGADAFFFPLSIQVPVVIFSTITNFGPIIFFSVPIIAFIYLWKRYQRLRADAQDRNRT